MKELEFNLDDNPFFDFHTSRYTMSARVSVEDLWNWCRKNDKSFFIMSLACLMNAVNSIPQLKRRIINGKAVEFEYLEATTPIMDKDKKIYKEMRVKIPQEFNDTAEWYDYVKKTATDILEGKRGFNLKMQDRDNTNIANFSCIPWVDFDAITSCEVNGRQIQPLITWGKVNKRFEMTISITVNHIFVNGYELGLFYKNAQKEFDSITKDL